MKRLTAFIIALCLLPVYQAYGDEQTPSLKGMDDTWHTVWQENFDSDSTVTEGQSVNNWNDWKLSAVLLEATMTSTLQKDPTEADAGFDNANKVMKLHRTAPNTENERPHKPIKINNSIQPMTGDLLVSGRLMVEKPNGNLTFTLRDSASGGATPGLPIIMVNLGGGNLHYEGQGVWQSIKEGAYPVNEWFDLVMILNTELRAYDIYINGSKMNDDPLPFYYPNAGTDGGHISRVDFDIKKEAKEETIWNIDDITVKTLTPAEEDVTPSTWNIAVQQDFQADAEMLDKSVGGWNNWSLANRLANPTLTSTIAFDPDEPSQGNYQDANKVLKLHRTAPNTTNERPYYTIKTNDQIEKVDGKFHVKMRLKAEKTDGNFAVTLKDSKISGVITMTTFNASGTIYNETQPVWNDLIKNDAYPRGEWFDFMMIVDTQSRTYDAYINGTMINDAPKPFYHNTSGKDLGHVSVLELDIKKEAKKEAIWYADDISVWHDYTDELIQLADSLTEQSLTNESLDGITKDLYTLPVSFGDAYTVKWTSDNPAAIGTDGKVNVRNFTQKASLTAEIIRDEEIPYIQNASCEKKFDLTVLPQAGATDLEILQDIADHYLTVQFLTDESLDQVTRDLNELLTEGPDGISFDWTSDDESVITTEGKVTRPSHDSGDAFVTLSVQMSKGQEALTKEFSITVKRLISTEEMLELAMDAVNYEDLTYESPDGIIGKLNLVSESVYDTKIQWYSDHPEIISNTGIVTRPDTDKEVVLTAVFTNNGQSKEKDFHFIVKMSPEAKLKADADQLDLGDLSGVVSSFALPDQGSIYLSEIKWSSNHSAITVSEGQAVVSRPGFEEGDASVTLTATLKNENSVLEKTFHAVVVKLPSDLSLVEEAHENLTFDKISFEDSGHITKNLALMTKLEHDVACAWSSSDESVVLPTGEVMNPLMGNPDRTVTLTAAISKGGAVLEKQFTMTVKAFETEEELLQKAKTALTFNALSHDRVDAVENDLTLPIEWKYGTSITWRSDDQGVLAISTGADGVCKGIVYRPDFHAGCSSVTLEAEISYGDKKIIKQFLLKIQEAELRSILIDHDTEDSSIGAFPGVQAGVWERPDAASAKIETAYDPVDNQNQVAKFYKPAALDASGSPFYVYKMPDNLSYAGNLIITGKFFMDAQSQGYYWFEVRGPNGSQIPVMFHADASVSCQVMVNNQDVMIHNQDFKFEKGAWVAYRIEVDTLAKRYHVFINEICITNDGSMYYNNEPYPTEDGVPYRYYADSSRSTSINGYRISIDTSAKSTDTIVYFDDVKFEKLHTYDSLLSETCAVFERYFLANINTQAVLEDLELPEITSGKVSVSYESSRPEVISETGKVNRGDQDETVIFTACFTLEDAVLKRPFTLIVKEKTVTALTDSEAVEADINNTVKTLKESCNFNHITQNLSFSGLGENGSVITYESDKQDVISNTGSVNRKSSDETVKITITAVKNGETAAETITLIVKGKPASLGGTSTQSSAVFGSSTVAKSGVDLDIVFADKNIFKDVPETHWAYDAIGKLAAKNIIAGVGKDIFEPERSVTREEFTKLLAGTFRLEDAQGETQEFDDIEPSHWAYEPIKILAAKRIINGIGDGRFGLGEEITRQDMAVMIHRAVKELDRPLPNARNYSEFADQNQIDDYAKDAVKALFEADMINGKDDNLFEPAEVTTRAEAAYILNDIREWLSKTIR